MNAEMKFDSRSWGLKLWAEANAEAEFGFKVHSDIGNFKLCPTGEPYVSYTTPIFATENEARAYFKNSMKMELHFILINDLFPIPVKSEGQKIEYDNTGKAELCTLYWRKLPTFVADNGGFRIKTRFIVSSKKKIMSADYNQN